MSSYTYWRRSFNCYHCLAILTNTGPLIIVQHHASGTGTGEAADSVFARVWTPAGTLTAFVYVCDNTNIYNALTSFVYVCDNTNIYNTLTAFVYVCDNTNIYNTPTAFVYVCDNTNIYNTLTVFVYVCDNTNIHNTLTAFVSICDNTNIHNTNSHCICLCLWQYKHTAVPLLNWYELFLTLSLQ